MPSKLEFSKWQGLGNDYIIVAAASLEFELTAPRVAVICDRHLGVGSDGMLVWGDSESADFRLDVYNPDGSRAEMCGNGIRMLARYLFDYGHIDHSTFAVDTDAGIIKPTVKPDGQVKVHMGTARLGGAGITGFEGIRAESEAMGQRLKAAGKEFEFTYVDMGNPHCVIETRSLEDVDLATVGPAIEHHELFPNRTNVEFMKVMGPVEVGMRVWERGVGETRACGTGACAVAVAAYRTKGIRSPMAVHLPGGDLQVEVDPEMSVVMTGPAQEVYSGTVSEDFIKRIREL